MAAGSFGFGSRNPLLVGRKRNFSSHNRADFALAISAMENEMGPCSHGYYGTCCVYREPIVERKPTRKDTIEGIRRVLKDAKPSNSDPVRNVFWRELVREMADSLFTRPNWSMKLTRSMEEWIEFTDEVGYLS